MRVDPDWVRLDAAGCGWVRVDAGGCGWITVLDTTMQGDSPDRAD